MGLRWFGPSWGAPVCEDTPHANTPVGQLCQRCYRPIEDGDEGFLMPFLTSDQPPVEMPMHRGCEMLGIIGHSYGLCHCTDFEGMDEYHAGLELIRRVEAESN